MPEADMPRSLEERLDLLEAQGVTIVDRRQVYLDDAIDPGRVRPGAILYPGTRLLGSNTFVGARAKIGPEGPAVLDNTVVGENAEVASGYLKDSVMLRDARVGANAHIRVGTLLEEEASTGHAVGLKHTVLMSFVTFGSLINFCDALISGGRSRKEHTEVGSGFIHFNYTPRGRSGDKATPSLIGDVPHGVFLRQPRIFLGGLSGIVGPQRVGFGSFTVAGQVLRREVPPNRIIGDAVRSIDKEFHALNQFPERIVKLNLEYIGQLAALQAWYRHVRLARIPASGEHDDLRVVTQAAADLLSVSIDERVQRLRQFLDERGLATPTPPSTVPTCPLRTMPSDPYVDHVAWVSKLSDVDIELGVSWLQAIVEQYVEKTTQKITGT
ncbi:MAG TPA: UDP-N-acetylglucosamine pyrophosphorylase [Xanthobacteraceae bacterium]|jgi:UDP-N-acetylglucosamine/UDP-N-acetylgalactosamine diphosphorylase|nr:UDP-N-acetylglucosamine pyrophosphorylase [Xanthobacteraceae bacterium]